MAIFQRTLTAIVATTALAGAFSLPAWAQAEPQLPTTEVTARSHHPHHGAKHAKADFAQHHAERSERLKTILQIQPNQQAAWDQYVKSTTPQARTQNKADRPDIRKLTTPERLDMAQKLRKERTAKAEQREQATRSFYQSLNPSQQKAFDQISLQRHGKHKAGHAGKRLMPSKHHHGHGSESQYRHPAHPAAPAA